MSMGDRAAATLGHTRPGGLAARSRRIRLSAAIMAHPRRADSAQSLAASLTGLRPRITFDPDPEGPPSTLRTGRLAWAAIAPGATHHLVIQDDVHPAPCLAERVTRLAAQRPHDAIVLFAEWGSVTGSAARVAALCGYRRVAIADDYVPTVAVVLPAGVAAEFARHTWSLGDDVADDVALYSYLRGTGVPAWLTLPNLVQHDNVLSLVGNSGMGARRSACWLPSLPQPPEGRDATFESDSIPYLCWWQSMAFVLRGKAAQHGRQAWTRVPAQQAADSLGEHTPPLGRRALHALRTTPHRRELEHWTHRIALQEAWAVAYLVGVCARWHAVHRSLPVPGASSLGDPVVLSSLRSLAPGGLRRLVKTAHLDAFTDLAEPFVRQAVSQGLAAGTGQPSSHPTPPGPAPGRPGTNSPEPGPTTATG